MAGQGLVHVWDSAGVFFCLVSNMAGLFSRKKDGIIRIQYPYTIQVGGLEHDFCDFLLSIYIYIYIYWEFHHPN